MSWCLPFSGIPQRRLDTPSNIFLGETASYLGNQRPCRIQTRGISPRKHNRQTHSNNNKMPWRDGPAWTLRSLASRAVDLLVKTVALSPARSQRSLLKAVARPWRRYRESTRAVRRLQCTAVAAARMDHKVTVKGLNSLHGKRNQATLCRNIRSRSNSI